MKPGELIRGVIVAAGRCCRKSAEIQVHQRVLPPDQFTLSKLEETKGALRELGLPEDVTTKTRGPAG
jgi:hypothetical protein